MKILVVYYSKTGSTEKVANDLAKKFDAEIDKIIDLTDRSGIVGWMYGGRDAMKGKLTEIKTEKNPKDYDLVIIGTPVWAWNSSPAARSYVAKFKNEFNKVVIFTTSGSTPPEKPVKYLETILEKKVECLAGWTTAELKNDKKYEEIMERFVSKIRQII